MRTPSSIALLAALCVALPSAASAQGAAAPQRITFDASGRATSSVGVRGGGGTGAVISVDYGQPHARGREIFGTLVPFDAVWRAGANRSTELTTDVALTVGGTRLAPGTYSLYLVPSRTEPRLVINSRTRQWGIPYNEAGEVARIPMRVQTLATPMETFTIALIPNPQAAGQSAPAAPGTVTMTMTWGTMQFSVDFAAQ